MFASPTPSRALQRASRELVQRLIPSEASLGGVELLDAPFAIMWSERTEVQPDMLVVPLNRSEESGKAETQLLVELVIEILSPSTARVDRYRKKVLYQRESVTEYWIVDVATRMVERWRVRDFVPEVLFETVSWKPHDTFDELSIDPADVFRVAHGEA